MAEDRIVIIDPFTGEETIIYLTGEGDDPGSPSITGTSGETEFIKLTDTPITYTGSENYVLTVSPSGDGVTFTPQEDISPELSVGILSGALDPRYVNITGDTMTGDLQIATLISASGNFITVDSNGQLIDSGITVSDLIALSGGLEGKYVNADGDTMTGSLTITGANLVLPDLITDDENILQLDANGNVISFELEESYVQVDDIINSDSTGTKGQWSFGNGFYYRCIADDTWVKYEVIVDVTTDVSTLTELVVTGDITITSLIPAEDNFLIPDATGKLVDSGFGVVSIAGITNGITQLDATYVNVTGDTMTGNLTITGASLVLPDLKTDDENVAQVDLFGNVITTELQELYVPVEDIITSNSTGIKGQWSYGLGYYYKCIATNTWIKYPVIVDTTSNTTNFIDIRVFGDLTLPSLSGSQTNALSIDPVGEIVRHEYAPVIGGKLTLNTVDSVYTVTDSNIQASANPVCSLTVPSSASTMFVLSIVDITNGNFKVALSEVPAISGYVLNWMCLEFLI